MSSSTATRTGRFSPPAASTRAPTPKSTPKPTRERRTLAGGAQVGHCDRPVLRIVASLPSSVVPAAPLAEPAVASAEPMAPLVEPFASRRVDLADFFAAEYDGDDVSVEIAEPRPSTLRLTRRGRLAVLAAGLAAALGVAFLAATGSLANDKPEPTRVVTVQPGQTLWEIASDVSSGADVRATMSHLEAINHLESTTLQVGQHLRVPK